MLNDILDRLMDKTDEAPQRKSEAKKCAEASMREAKNPTNSGATEPVVKKEKGGKIGNAKLSLPPNHPPVPRAVLERAKREAGRERRRSEIRRRVKSVGCGYFTRRGMELWREQVKREKEAMDSHKPEDSKSSSDTLIKDGNRKSRNKEANLVAEASEEKPLYFWQLYSILGKKRIHNIVKNFYTRVYAANSKEDQWFLDPFARISGPKHHIATQTAFWLDAMGCGDVYYHGGEYRLHFHHQHNAKEVMTQKGAIRWMQHMRAALDKSDLTDDPRVRRCINGFLYVIMEQYAREFYFDTGEDVYGKNFDIDECVINGVRAMVEPKLEEEEKLEKRGQEEEKGARVTERPRGAEPIN